MRTVGVVDAVPEGVGGGSGRQRPGGPVVEVVAVEDRPAGEAALTVEDDPIDVLVAEGPGWYGQAELESLMTLALTQVAFAARVDALGLGPSAVGELLQPLELASATVEGTDAEEAEEEQEDRGPQVVIATFGMILLFVSITFYGSYILMSVVEGKQNRVVEVLLAHVHPRDLLAGKALGHGVLGLVQILSIAAIAAIGLAITDPPAVPDAAYGTIAGVVMWFLLGYAFHSITYAALGSLASTTEDAQSAVAPSPC